ncbi:GNAT family N-acetyltransferase [Aeromicrobium fastidiosum]|uniref:GNAT family N-acetyltransferase n=2 Tax=Aeromicrobium fastidiosum TaxID=52699 RepID=UPI00165EF74D|nr:hypothetical protein [Aeromicrobium fastidiosum]MBP2391681.1 hypothetical protein [Aeromicrobium fastidiosum]
MAMTHDTHPGSSGPKDFTLDSASTRAASVHTTGRFGNHDLVLRPPQLLDGPGWRHTCLREADRLKPSIGAADVDWEKSVSLTSWADKVTAQRAAARAGRLVPLVLANGGGDVLGEISFAVDPRTGVAELSIWLSANTSAPARAWAWRTALTRVVGLPAAVRGVVAPVAVTNTGPGRMLTELGFTRRATTRQLRPYDGVPTDHDIWWLPRTTPAEAAPDLARQVTGRSWATTLRSCALMMLPCARVAVRRGRRVLRRSTTPSAQLPHAHDHGVRLPHDGFGTVTMDDGSPAGVADIRHDHGTSTLEVWTDLKNLDGAQRVAQTLLDVADTTGARRLAWSVRPGSVEQVAAAAVGFAPEGQTSPPVWACDVPHELWGRAQNQAHPIPTVTNPAKPQPKEP